MLTSFKTRKLHFYRVVFLLWMLYPGGVSIISGQEYQATFDYQESTQITAKVWTKKDGLPAWEIFGLFEDSRGIVWIQNGLNLCQFDGQAIEIKATKEEKLYEGTATMLGEDQRGNIWRYRTFKRPDGKNALDRIRIYDPFLDQDLAVSEYVPTADLPSFLSPETVLFSVDQMVYLSDPTTGRLWRFGDQLDLVFEGPANLQSKAITYLPAPNQNYWGIETIDGYQVRKKVYLFNTDKEVLKSYPIEPMVGLFLDQSRQIWSFNLQPIISFPYNLQPLPMPVLLEGGNEPHTFKERMQGPIIPQYTDFNKKDFFTNPHNDRLALTSGTIGIGRIGNQSFTYNWWLKRRKVISNDTEGSLPLQLFDVLAEKIPYLKERFVTPYFCGKQLKDGTLLFGHPKGLTQVKFRKKHFKSIFPGKPVRGIDLIDPNRLAASYVEDLAFYLIERDLEKNTEKIIPPPQNVQRENIYSITTKGDSIWLGLANGGLEIYDDNWQLIAVFPPPGPETYIENKSLRFPTDSTVCYATNKGLIETNHRSGRTRILPQIDKPTHWIHQDQTGAYWIGTSEGLYHWESGQYYLDTLPDGTPIPVSHLYEDTHGIFWIATQKGLFKWKPFSDTYEQFTREDGLLHNIIHAVYPDQFGRLWLSTNFGITAFDTLNYFMQNFTDADGILDSEQNFQSHTQGPDGQLLFGGMGGVTTFYPDQIPLEQQQLPYGISIKKMELFDKNGYLFDTVKTAHSDTSILRIPKRTKQIKLSIEYPNYSNIPVALRWRINEQSYWNDLGQNREFMIMNLDHGANNVSLHAQSTKNNWRTQSRTITIYRPYPVSHQIWFWVLVAGLSLLLIWGLIRYQSYRVKRQNEQLKRLVRANTQQLADKAKALSALDHTKNELFKKISHELRTPLSLLYLSSEDLNETRLPAAATNTAQRIQDQVEQMKDLVEEILSLGEDPLSSPQVNKEAVEWNSFLQKCFIIFDGLAEKKNIQYHLHRDRNQEVYVMLDIAKMEQILNNLINNALKFTPVGGRVTVHSIQKEDQLQIVVSDTGRGVRPGEQAYIFEPYYQTPELKAHAPKNGQGLGLSICREYIELLGGKIWLESTYGNGSRFYVQVPLEPAPSSFYSVDVSTDQQGTGQPVQVATGKKDIPRILVVEDNVQLQAELKRILGDQYQVQTASNGKIAFEILSKSEPGFDLIISDIMMPIMDGFELLEKIKAHPDLGLTPFLFLTALSKPETELKSLRWGVDAFVSKPFSKVELLARVENLVRNQLARKAAQAALQISGASTNSQEWVGAAPDQSITDYQTEWLNQLEELIQNQFSESNLKISDIAFQLNISERTFRSRLKEYTGMTPSAYLQQVRLQYALLYLERKKYMTISEVAYAVGFKDAGYFSRIFRKAFGKSPSDYF